ncbi:MAG TPA: DegV family protein [Dehalococcoidia bacterium]|nr:DegV family protein [Dehalococcoidia bacterium]
MTVKVVVDSTSDIPDQIARELGITVVPTYVVFGGKAYRDRLDISEDELYEKLVSDSVHPTTSVPSPQDFADVYNRLARETDCIVSIHPTSKSSGVYNSALMGKELVERKCRIEVMDSLLVAMSCGIIAIAAAKEANAGANLERVVEVVRESIPRMHLLIMLDTLKYLVRGGRLGKGYGLLGSVLKVKPLLTVREGKAALVGVTRTKANAVKRLYDFPTGFSRVSDIAVSYTTDHDEAQRLAEQIKARFPQASFYLTRVGPVLGTHAGPGGMAVIVREAEEG